MTPRSIRRHLISARLKRSPKADVDTFNQTQKQRKKNNSTDNNHGRIKTKLGGPSSLVREKKRVEKEDSDILLVLEIGYILSMLL